MMGRDDKEIHGDSNGEVSHPFCESIQGIKPTTTVLLQKMAKHVSQDKNFSVFGDGVETTPDDVKRKLMEIDFFEDVKCKPLDIEAEKYDVSMKLKLLNDDEEEEEKLEVDKEMLKIFKDVVDEEDVREGKGEEPMILIDEEDMRHATNRHLNNEELALKEMEIYGKDYVFSSNLFHLYIEYKEKYLEARFKDKPTFVE
ncbi:unnamed protein product [Lactuca saligna]|uniref:Uncharacterized protein n=1 Tax=Lactuca saligna TaxID=75948 RepID=A0AA35XZY4_LACSI|nr:unnamed protein product [Lactuca saligna]